jgi:hypothetical protein
MNPESGDPQPGFVWPEDSRYSSEENPYPDIQSGMTRVRIFPSEAGGSPCFRSENYLRCGNGKFKEK